MIEARQRRSKWSVAVLAQSLLWSATLGFHLPSPTTQRREPVRLNPNSDLSALVGQEVVVEGEFRIWQKSPPGYVRALGQDWPVWTGFEESNALDTEWVRVQGRVIVVDGMSTVDPPAQGPSTTSAVIADASIQAIERPAGQ